MSREIGHGDVRHRTQQLLEGPLKHVRSAALAAALIPLASVVATPAAAQGLCPPSSSGGMAGMTIGDFVWNDSNQNGVQDNGEAPLAGAIVTVSSAQLGSFTQVTGSNGIFSFSDMCPDTYTVSVMGPTGMLPSPAGQGTSTSLDSDGMDDGHGYSTVLVALTESSYEAATDIDFGFFVPTVSSPGTGTPGYWKNHPEAWPQPTITVGGVSYTVAQAISWMNAVGGDKTITMFGSLVSATLNVLIGNDSSCVASTIAEADAWMSTRPVGSKVKASSVAWKLGEPLHRLMDNYNNGMLCAPHRD